MIKCEVRRNSTEVRVDADVEGPLSEIIDDVCRIVRAIHDEIQEGDPELAEAFRDCIQDLMDPMGAVWKGLEDREQLILAVVKEPGKEARMEAIGNSLEDLQAAVGGYIETVTVAEDLVLIVNEEGRLKGLPVNCRVLGHDLVGTVVAVGVKGEEFCSLSPSALEAAMELLGGKMPELKPCPFCGSTSFFGDTFPELTDHDIVELYVVECNGCMARGPAKETPEEAEEAWNRRAEDGK